MSAEFFDRSYSHCPVCQGSTLVCEGLAIGGLKVCPHCGARLVVSGSGHYVRDPFRWQLPSVKILRHQSHPLSRLVRDSGLKTPSSAMALIASLFLLGITTAYSGNLSKFFVSFPIEQNTQAPPRQ
ncbi:hypothetical protein ACN4EG_02405 [Alkalinema pantanalense CENA528]|uniref:hypothetical protein n=1 Tax=Alkalinema pantanalense TaxID=1620705 RepID=UPI003D6E152A